MTQTLRPILIATALFLVILFVQPTISKGSEIIFDYLIRFIFCLLIGFGLVWVVDRKRVN